MNRPANEIDESTFRGRVAARIRARRERLGKTPAQAADAVGIPLPTWRNWERGRRLPLEALPLIAQALSCGVRQLLPDE